MPQRRSKFLNRLLFSGIACVVTGTAARMATEPDPPSGDQG
jgi:hypothetical protein